MSFPPYIYALFDAREPGRIRYIGMATANPDRAHYHSRYARRPSAKHSHLVHWIQRLHADGRDYSVAILETFEVGTSRDVVGASERALIAGLRADGHSLVNVAEGGTGGMTGRHTPECRERIRLALLGRQMSAETRLKLSLSKIGNKACVGRACSPETRAKRSASVMAWARSPKGKAVNSAARKRYYEDPANRARQSESQKAAWVKRRERKALKCAV